MNKLFLVVIFTQISIVLYSQEYSRTDSILNNQVKVTNDICREIKNLTKEISELGENINPKDSIFLNTITKNANKNYDSITNKITAIIRESGKEKDGFNFLDFLSGALAEMIGAFIGAGAAVWIFFRQTEKEKKKENDKEQKELTEKNHYLGSLLQSSISLAKEQNEGIKTFYEKINDNPLYIPLIPIVPKQDLEGLSQLICNEGYYHAFLNKYGNEIENVKKYRKIASSINFLNSQIDQMFDMQDKQQKFDHERKKNYKALFDRARDNAIELGIRNEKSNPDLYESIGKILKEYYEKLTDRFDLTYHQENLVEPLEKILFDKIKDIPECYQIFNDLKNATLIYSEIQYQNKNYSNDFRKIHSLINKAVDNLETNGSELIKEFKMEKNVVANKVENDNAS